MTERVSSPGATTVELSTVPAEPARPHRGGFGRELAGALAIGLSVLAVVVLVFQGLAWIRDMPGPGVAMVLGHLGAAVLALLAQRVVDRSSGWPATVAAVAVVAITAATMWLLWWA